MSAIPNPATAATAIESWQRNSICEQIRRGRSLEDACLIVSVDLPHFQALLQAEPLYARQVQRSQEICQEQRRELALEQARTQDLNFFKPRLDPPPLSEAPRRGRPRANFGPQLVAEILRLIEAGYGRNMACKKLRIGPKRFRRILLEKPNFAAAVRVAEASRVESCEFLLLKLAHDDKAGPSNQIRAAVAYLGRRERVEKARQTRRERQEARAREAGAPDASPEFQTCSDTTPADPEPLAPPRPDPEVIPEVPVTEIPEVAGPTPAEPSLPEPEPTPTATGDLNENAQSDKGCVNAAGPIAPSEPVNVAAQDRAPDGPIVGPRPAPVAPTPPIPPNTTLRPRRHGRRHHRPIRGR